MKKNFSLLLCLTIVGLVASCGETSSSSLSSSAPSSSSSSSSSSSLQQTEYKNVNLGENELAGFEYAKTTYEEDGVEKNLNMQTLYTNQNSPHLDPLEEQRILVVPFGFQDENLKTNVQTEANIERIRTCFFGTQEEMSAKGGWYSVFDFYERSSFGKSQLDGDVLNTWVEYNGTTQTFLNNAKGSSGTYAASYIRDWYITEYKKENHGSLGENANPLSYYDQNNDGFIDLLWMVYSNPYTSDQTWWAYVTYTQEVADLTNPQVKTLGWASINFLNDAFGGYDTHTLIHETGHTFGLDDYYDYTDSWSPMGAIDMMDNNIGDHCAFSKFTLGWLSPLVVDDSAIVTLRPTASTGDCFIIPSPNYNGTAFDEYFMIEFMSPVGLSEYDYKNGYKYINGFSKNGIRITHVDARAVAGASTLSENYVTNPQDGVDFRVNNSKGGRQGDGSDSNFFPVDGEYNPYSLTMIIESNPDKSNNTTTTKGASASNDSLFGPLSRFTLEGEDNIWADIYMPSKSNLWNKAKTMTGGNINKQTYEIDETCTFDYIIQVLNVSNTEARVKVTKIER